MEKINIKSLDIDSITEEDAEGVAQLTQLVYGKEIGYVPDDLIEQLKIFPEGQIRIKHNDEVIACCSSLIINFEDYGAQHSLVEITDYYKITNHNPNGDTLYGFDVTVHPDYRRRGLAKKLYDVRREICRKYNLKRIMFGGRLPNYHKYADQLSIHEYVQQVIDGKLTDPVFTFQLKNGFEFVDIIEGYIPEDEESKSFATLMEWRNDSYIEK